MQVGLSSGSDAGWVEFPQDGEHWSKICVTLGKVSQVPAKAAALVADRLFVGAANQIAVLLTKTRGLYRDERPPGEVTSVEPMLSSGSVIIFIKGQSTANQHFSSRNKRSKNRKKKEKENPDAGGEA